MIMNLKRTCLKIPNSHTCMPYYLYYFIRLLNLSFSSSRVSSLPSLSLFSLFPSHLSVSVSLVVSLSLPFLLTLILPPDSPPLSRSPFGSPLCFSRSTSLPPPLTHTPYSRLLILLLSPSTHKHSAGPPGGREYGRVEGGGAAMQFHRLAKVLPGPQVLTSS